MAEGKFSIFGQIKETANISNLTLSNVSVKVTLSRQNIHTQAYLVFMSKAAAATVSNVVISMAETDAFVIEGYANSVVDNINGMGDATYETCLFGGYTTDAEYVTEAAGQGFTVLGTPEEFITIK